MWAWKIQSRAENNTIEDNRIFDNGSTASYSISLPNGGRDLVESNVIEKGPDSQNGTTIIDYYQAMGSGVPEFGTDQGHWPGSQLKVTGNTFVNDLSSQMNSIRNNSTIPVVLSDNKFWNIDPTAFASGSIPEGSDAMLGPASVSGSVTLATPRPPFGTLGGTDPPRPAGTSVPEPASLALLGIGLVGLGIVRRKRS